MSTVGRVGRPIGYICSEETKARIADSRRGSKWHPYVKEKISKSLKEYFENDPNHIYGIAYFQGYRYIWQSDEGRYEAEHRIIAEEILGRSLEDNEVVHHIDGDRLNNDPSNLLVVLRKYHLDLHRLHKEDDKNYLLLVQEKNLGRLEKSNIAFR